VGLGLLEVAVGVLELTVGAWLTEGPDALAAGLGEDGRRLGVPVPPPPDVHPATRQALKTASPMQRPYATPVGMRAI
jgi:hypothetical protein